MRSLPTGLAEAVGKHLLMSGRLIDTDPAAALQHAEWAQSLASRLACTREALAMAAYANGDYRVAMREARTVRRMTGDESWLPLIADCERGLGRPDRALDLLRQTDLSSLPLEDQAEALIVMAGARSDLGQTEAALAVLDVKALRRKGAAEWLARMRLAYSELLAGAGRGSEAAEWLRRAEEADPEGVVVHPERFDDLASVEFIDNLEESVDDTASPTGDWERDSGDDSRRGH